MDIFLKDIQVSLSSSMIIKTGRFFFLSFCWIITPISGIIYKSFLCYGKNFKKIGRNKEQIKKKYTLIIIKILITQTAGLGSNHWLLKSVL